MKRTPLPPQLVFMLYSQGLAADETQYTAGFTNGRGWAEMPVIMRAAYIKGLGEGSEWVRNRTDLLPSEMNFGEIVGALDDYYHEPTNGRMPVPMALTYIERKAGGASEAELRDLETRLRKDLGKLLTE